MTPGGTIAALASAPGPSPRAVVRVSGDLNDLGSLFTEPLGQERGAVRRSLVLAPGAALPVLVAVTVAPASYTGQDSLDIVLCGGPAVVERVLGVVAAAPGVRHAEAGEFTARAYINGRIDLDSARAVAMTIAAASADELRAAQRLTGSSLADRASSWSGALSRLLALVEAGIDFADQDDVVAIQPSRLAGELGKIAAEMNGHVASASGGERPTGLPRVVLVGAPSAGKSTLFNALIGRERSAVHESPGTTRDAVAEELALPGGGRVELVDLAGLDRADRHGLVGQIQRRARAEVERADAIVHCDPSGAFEAQMDPAIPTLRVRTKADRPIAGVSRAAVDVCALDGWRLDELRTRIAVLAGQTGADAGGAIAARLGTAFRRACGHLAGAQALAGEGTVRWELVAGEMRSALDCLGILTGRVDPDEVLGLIFRTFCIGK